MNEWVGRELDGRYQIEHLLGEGGMGVVLRGKHKFTGVAVAIKILRRELQLDADVQQRFLAEAQAPNAIGHPGIVKVLDAGRSQEGQLYMVMELLTGRSLRVPVYHRQLSSEQIQRVMQELLAVLGHAHAKGFVHRDLKPDNVFLCAPADEVKLLDFGIAKVLASSGRTVAGALLGTPAYMAPEQLADARNVDQRADLWAVGIMLYEMVAGRVPFHGTTPMDVMNALAANQLIPIRQALPSASPALEAFFARALAPDPRLRFGAAAELAQAIGALPLQNHRSTAQAGAATAPAAPPTAPATAGATVASYAAAPAGPMPSQLASPPHQPVQPAVSNGTKLAIGGLVAVGVIAIIAIIAATRGGSKAKPDDARDAGTPIVVDPDRAPDASGPRDRAACEVKCGELVNRCHAGLPTCVDDCLLHASAFDACFDRSMRDCNDGAICGYGAVCNGRIPNGVSSCQSILGCQIQCAQSFGLGTSAANSCGCDCVTHLDARQAITLARLNACGFRCAATGDCNCDQFAPACQ